MIFLIRMKNFGLHKIIKESANCYYFKNKDDRTEGVLKRKWYVLKLRRNNKGGRKYKKVG